MNRRGLRLILPLHHNPPEDVGVEHVFNIDTGEIVGVVDVASGTKIIVSGDHVHMVAGDYKILNRDQFLHLFECAKCLLLTNN